MSEYVLKVDCPSKVARSEAIIIFSEVVLWTGQQKSDLTAHAYDFHGNTAKKMATKKGFPKAKEAIESDSKEGV